MSPLYQLFSSALPRKIVVTLGTITVILPSYPVNKCILLAQIAYRTILNWNIIWNNHKINIVISLNKLWFGFLKFIFIISNILTQVDRRFLWKKNTNILFSKYDKKTNETPEFGIHTLISMPMYSIQLFMLTKLSVF